MHVAKTSGKSAVGLHEIMGRFGNVNPDALELWQSHDQRCDGADGHLSIAPKVGDAVLFYNHFVVSQPLVCSRRGWWFARMHQAQIILPAVLKFYLVCNEPCCGRDVAY